MKVNVLSFSLKFLMNLFQGNDRSKINRLFVLIDKENTLINNKKIPYTEIYRLKDSSSHEVMLKNSEQEIYPKTDEQNLRYYLFWHLAGTTDSYMQQNGTAMTDVNSFLKFYESFLQTHTKFFSDNNITTWSDKILRYLFTTKKLIIYDAYCLNTEEKIEYNINPFLKNIQCGSEKIVIIITSNKRINGEQLSIDYFEQQYEKIKQNVSGIKLLIFIKNGHLPSPNRFILTDYFYIKPDHALEVFNRHGLKRNGDSLTFNSLLDDTHKENYYLFIKSEVKTLIENFIYDSPNNRNEDEIYIELPNQDEILGIDDFENKEEIINILDSF